MDEVMTSFRRTMRYQLSTFKQPDGEVPSDPKETIRQRARSIDPEQRERTKSKEKKPPRKKRSTGYKLEVQKSIDTPVKAVESQRPAKIKRQAPTPPKQTPKSEKVKTNDNPFMDDEESNNPFLDDDGDAEGSGNPFLDDNEESEGGKNPFLD